MEGGRAHRAAANAQGAVAELLVELQKYGITARLDGDGVISDTGHHVSLKDLAKDFHQGIRLLRQARHLPPKSPGSPRYAGPARYPDTVYGVPVDSGPQSQTQPYPRPSSYAYSLDMPEKSG